MSIYLSLSYSQEVIKFDERNSPLKSSNINCIAIDSSNSVWIGTNNKQLLKYKLQWNEVSDIWDEIDSSRYDIGSIEVSPNGTIWVSVSSQFGGDVYFNRNDNWGGGIGYQYGTYSPGSIYVENDSTLYYPLINMWPHSIMADMVGIFNNDSLHTYPSPCLKKVIPLNKDSVLVSNCFGISIYNRDSIVTINPDEWIPENISKIKNHIYIFGEKFSKYEDYSFFPYPEIDSALFKDSLTITSVTIEDEDIFWIGTNKGDLIRFKENIEIYKLTEKSIIEIEIDKYKNKWFITSEGCFLFNEDKIVDVDNDRHSHSSYLLSQNYPNPFNPSTIIRYSLPTSGMTKIYLYDILGREIMILVDEFKSVGNYEIKVNAEYLSNGIYFYRIISGHYSETKKMIVVK
ncbi:MAG: T9SS type A sorting domain-containing protein [Erysipelotrichaceae bacterium]|nr:T9SS type A sorting domain-containing protein [Erysipelotrichaceae bacterium]